MNTGILRVHLSSRYSLGDMPEPRKPRDPNCLRARQPEYVLCTIEAGHARSRQRLLASHGVVHQAATSKDSHSPEMDFWPARSRLLPPQIAIAIPSACEGAKPTCPDSSTDGRSVRWKTTCQRTSAYDAAVPASLAHHVVEAVRRRYRMVFTRATDLVCELLEACDERTLTRLLQRYRRVNLLIIDELGFVPFERAGRELLFNLLSDRYECRATVVTTNLAFGEWVAVFGDEKLPTAMLDRLGHHAHVLATRGTSYRSLRGKTAGVRLGAKTPKSGSTLDKGRAENDDFKPSGAVEFSMNPEILLDNGQPVPVTTSNNKNGLRGGSLSKRALEQFRSLDNNLR